MALKLSFCLPRTAVVEHSLDQSQSITLTPTQSMIRLETARLPDISIAAVVESSGGESPELNSVDELSALCSPVKDLVSIQKPSSIELDDSVDYLDISQQLQYESNQEDKTNDTLFSLLQNERDSTIFTFAGIFASKNTCTSHRIHLFTKKPKKKAHKKIKKKKKVLDNHTMVIHILVSAIVSDIFFGYFNLTFRLLLIFTWWADALTDCELLLVH